MIFIRFPIAAKQPCWKITTFPVAVKPVPVQAFFAQEHEKHVFCYANANLIRHEQTKEVIRFVDYWQDLTGRNPEWLYFDSKPTTYAELSELNLRKVYFVTIRRRGPGILKRLDQRPQSDWIPATIDIPKRRQKRIRYLDENIRLDDYDGTIRQIAVTGLGREQPTLFVASPAPMPFKGRFMHWHHGFWLSHTVAMGMAFPSMCPT